MSRMGTCSAPPRGLESFPPTQRSLGSWRLAAGGPLRRKRLFPLLREPSRTARRAGGFFSGRLPRWRAASASAAYSTRLHVGALRTWRLYVRPQWGQTAVHTRGQNLRVHRARRRARAGPVQRKTSQASARTLRPLRTRVRAADPAGQPVGVKGSEAAVGRVQAAEGRSAALRRRRALYRGVRRGQSTRLARQCKPLGDFLSGDACTGAIHSARASPAPVARPRHPAPSSPPLARAAP